MLIAAAVRIFILYFFDQLLILNNYKAATVVYPMLALALEAILHGIRRPAPSHQRVQRSRASMMGLGNAITVRGLTKSFVPASRLFAKKTSSVTAIDSLDLDFPPSGIHVLCGKNGCGKTTLSVLFLFLFGMSIGS